MRRDEGQALTTALPYGAAYRVAPPQVPVLFLAVASLLIRRSQDALKVLLMLSGHTK